MQYWDPAKCHPDKIGGRNIPSAWTRRTESNSVRWTEAPPGGRKLRPRDRSSVPPNSVRRTEAPVRRTELGGTELPSPLRPEDRASVCRTNWIPSGGRSTPSPAFPRRTKRKRSGRMMGFVRGRTAADEAEAASSPDADLRRATKRRRPERTKPAGRTNRLPRGRAGAREPVRLSMDHPGGPSQAPPGDALHWRDLAGSSCPRWKTSRLGRSAALGRNHSCLRAEGIPPPGRNPGISQNAAECQPQALRAPYYAIPF